MSESEVRFTLNIDVRPMVEAMRKAVRATHGFYVALLRPKARRVHRRRCATCSPFANPRPLSIDGHAYRRRSMNRRGKR